MGSVSLVSGWFPPTTVAVALLALLGSLGWRERSVLRRQLLYGVPMTAGLVGLVALVDDGVALVPYQFPNSYYFWLGLVVLAVAWFVLGWIPLSLLRLVLGVLACLLTTVMAVTLINQHYQFYPTISSVLGKNAQNQVAEPELRQARLDYRRIHRLPDHGFTLTLPLPGTTSGFAGRPAYVWLPPIWVTEPTPQLPVIELLHGTPGGPADWTRAGYADQTATEFAQSHGGRAPIVVMPDINGSEFGDTECVNSQLGNVETYLTVDVLSFVAEEFSAKVSDRSAAIAGYSEGGTCALMLALRHPTIYRAFADFSGLTSPTVSEQVDPAATTQALFGGSRQAYDAHDPLNLLRTARYPNLSGWFDAGLSDPAAIAAQQQLVPLARAAGIAVCSHQKPGGHDEDFWTGAFRRALPWLSGQLGVTPAAGCG